MPVFLRSELTRPGSKIALMYQDFFAFWEGNPVPRTGTNPLQGGVTFALRSGAASATQIDSTVDTDDSTTYTCITESTTNVDDEASPSIPCYVTPASDVMKWSMFPEFRSNAARRVWPASKYSVDYVVENDMSQTHPVLFISHQWRTSDHPDPEGLDCVLLRKIVAIIVGIAAFCETRRRHQQKKKDEQKKTEEQTEAEKEKGVDQVTERLFRAKPAMTNVQLLMAGMEDHSESENEPKKTAFDRYCEGFLIRHFVFGSNLVMRFASDDDLSRLTHATLGVLEEAFVKQLSSVDGIDTRSLEAEIAASKAGKLVSVWLDYSSLPQQPRSAIENEYFKQALSLLFTWQKRMVTVVLYRGLDDTKAYHTRLWCVCEDMCGSRTKVSTQNLLKSYYAGSQDQGTFAILQFCEELRTGVAPEDRTLHVTNGSDIVPIMKNLAQYVDHIDCTSLGDILFNRASPVAFLPLTTGAAIVQAICRWSPRELDDGSKQPRNEFPTAFDCLVDAITLKQILIDMCLEISTMSKPVRDQPEIETTREALQKSLDYGVRKVFHKYAIIDRNTLIVGFKTGNKQEWAPMETKFAKLPSEWIRQIQGAISSGGFGALIITLINQYDLSDPSDSLRPDARHMALRISLTVGVSKRQDQDELSSSLSTLPASSSSSAPLPASSAAALPLTSSLSPTSSSSASSFSG